MLDPQRNPVLFPKDADACSIGQVLEDFEFQVINLTQKIATLSVLRDQNVGDMDSKCIA
jgi:hypothetical protein